MKLTSGESVSLFVLASLLHSIVGFCPHHHHSSKQSVSTALNAVRGSGLSPLPRDISPFEKSSSKSRDIQGEFRKISQSALQRAIKDGVKQLEIEFPPLLGGDKSKSQFDDFDNLTELNKNRDWCIQLCPSLDSGLNKPIWLIFPDLKECELAKDEWTGQRYRQSAVFSSIEAVTKKYSGGDSTKAWGETFASGMSQLLGGSDGDAGLLGDQASLDPLDASPGLHLVCQPGNAGPVEDWINVAAFHQNSGGEVPTCIVNGALDKVRDGYYPAFIFPALGKTFPFYRQFEAAFFLKPISDKGLYGWLYRVYPEPWQVYLQQPYKKNGNVVVQDTLALTSDTRPSYNDCVQALLSAAASNSQ